MLALRIIEERDSGYTAHMILVETPGRDTRVCIDHKKLNAVMRDDFFSITKHWRKVGASDQGTVYHSFRPNENILADPVDP